MMMVIYHPLIIYCSIAADEELWDDGPFPHYMQGMTMKYWGEIIS